LRKNNLRILITNDDGYRAEGIKVLEEIARSITNDVWVVAPDTEQSGVSHSLTLRTPLRIISHSDDERHFSVDGTPTDSVVIALKRIMLECKPDLVLSGINHGSNLGEDITYSGTVSAAMEATLLDVPAIALSQKIGLQDNICFDVAKQYAKDVILKLFDAKIPYNTLMNVNFPHCDIDEVKGVKIMPQGKRKIGDNLYEYHDPRGKPCYWIGFDRSLTKERSDSDLFAVNDGYITITPISLDLTNYTELNRLKENFNGYQITKKTK
jgi:5'-nucleotidase